MFMAGFQREFVGKGSCNEILSGVGNVAFNESLLGRIFASFLVWVM